MQENMEMVVRPSHVTRVKLVLSAQAGHGSPCNRAQL